MGLCAEGKRRGENRALTNWTMVAPTDISDTEGKAGVWVKRLVVGFELP